MEIIYTIRQKNPDFEHDALWCDECGDRPCFMIVDGIPYCSKCFTLNFQMSSLVMLSTPQSKHYYKDV